MKKLWIGLVPAALAVILLALALRSCGRTNAGADTADAVAALQAMEAGDPDEVVAAIRRQQKEKRDAEREQTRAALLSGELDPFGLMQDYVILGDSRPAGFYYYGLLPGDRNLSNEGDTIREIPGKLDEIVALHPARAYLSFGINDINIGYWDSPEEYTAEFVEVLDVLREALPDLKIYVNSILPVQDWALYKGEAWPRVPEYNVALRAMCEEYGCTYIDNDAIVAEHQELYDSDGIHFTPEFYTYWVTNWVMASLYSDTEEEWSE